MKTTLKDFEKFQAEFVRWQNQLGLTHYQVVFEHRPLDGSFANIVTNHTGKVATVTLTRNLAPANIPHFHPTQSGRHEAFHLLLARLTSLAHTRYLFAQDIDEEEEAIVRRLEALFDEREKT